MSESFKPNLFAKNINNHILIFFIKLQFKQYLLGINNVFSLKNTGFKLNLAALEKK